MKFGGRISFKLNPLYGYNLMETLRAALDYVYGDADHRGRIVRTLEIYFVCGILCMVGAIGGAFYLAYIAYLATSALIGGTFQMVALDGPFSRILGLKYSVTAILSVASGYLLMRSIVFTVYHASEMFSHLVDEFEKMPVSYAWHKWKQLQAVFSETCAREYAIYIAAPGIIACGQNVVAEFSRVVVSAYLAVFMIEITIHMMFAAAAALTIKYICRWLILWVYTIDMRAVGSWVLDLYVQIANEFIQHQESAEAKNLKAESTTCDGLPPDWSFYINGRDITGVIKHMKYYLDCYTIDDLNQKLTALGYFVQIGDLFHDEKIIQLHTRDKVTTIDLNTYKISYGTSEEQNEVEIFRWRDFIEQLINIM